MARHRQFLIFVALAAVLGGGLLFAMTLDFRVGKPASTIPVVVVMSQIDQAVKKLPVGNVTFNTPTQMVRGQPTTVELKVSRHRPTVISITVPGQKVVTMHVRLSDEMKASLTGVGFNISSSDPPVQLIGLNRPREWHWQVEPTTNGSLRLDLTLLALVNVNHRTSGFYTVRTLHRTWNVNVSWDARLASFLDTNWQWLWAFILVPVGGFVWRRRARRAANAARHRRRAAPKERRGSR